MNRNTTINFDAAPSARSIDENGFLHVGASHITKAAVNPYYGREIPGWREAGLDPEAVYYGFRDPEELKKSLSTWQGLPLHIEHHIDSAEEPEKLTRVGAVGTGAAWNPPYVDAPLTVWDRAAIKAIEDGSFRELSCAYRYDPDFTPGEYEGIPYDFVMRNIRGNHVALVGEGRAGPDVVVADAKTVGGKAALVNALERLAELILGRQPDTAQDDRWITVHPNGANNTGRPALIDENGTIKAGMGGKFNGRNIDDVPRGENPHPVTEEKHQARQQRQAQKQRGSSSPLDVSKLSDQEIDDRIFSIGRAWYRATDAEKEEFYAIKKEFDKRRKEKNAELDRKRDERSASPEYQAELKRREEAAARRDHVREREREITSSTYERAQARLRKPFDDRLKKQLGIKGQAHDAAFEEGKHPRDKSGRFGKGSGESENKSDNAASGKEITLTGKELGDYKDVKELRQKAVDYYKEHLQGKPAHRDDIGEIRFSRKGRGETFSFSVNPDKLLIIPALRDIIEKGKLGREEALNHPRKDGIVAFIPVTKTVNLKGRPQEVEVLLGKDENGNLYYDMFLEQRKNPLPVTGSHNPRPAGDSTGFQPAVDLNIAIKPVRVNPQPDADTTRTPKLIQGAFMGKLKRWFRGAQDDNPEIEKQEVELAQAIIDLHKVDPVTGEIADIAEDEDKAEEIRRIIGELSAKLDPEDVKRLTDSLSDLACSKAAGDADPDKAQDEDKETGNAMDEDQKKAMDACGLDADDPQESKAFGEGVKYGEALEKNPSERAKLDKEHESEGMKKAMDACGLDAENPQESKAFAEGVKYGEKLIRNPEERRKLDREHESEGMTGDEDKNAAIERILADVPGLTPEQRKKLTDSLSDLAYSPATGDADPADPKAAQDRAFRRRGPRPLTALDAARIKASAIAEAQDHMRKLSRAVRDVRGLVGDLDPLAFDSASDVYGYALEQSGINPRAYPRQGWRGMIDVLRSRKAEGSSGHMARDAAPTRLDGNFAGLKNITIAE